MDAEADLRRADADLLVRLREQESRLARIENLLHGAAWVRAVEREERGLREKDRRHRLIRKAAAYMAPDCPERTAQRIERLFSGTQAVPTELVGCIEQLRHAYGNGGPSRQTIRRALPKFPRE